MPTDAFLLLLETHQLRVGQKVIHSLKQAHETQG